MNYDIASCIGYTFAIVVGHWCIAPVVDGLWKRTSVPGKQAEENRPAGYLPRIVGMVERALFVASLQMGEAEFIGIWLALKVAGQWSRWLGGEAEMNSGRPEGRTVYNIFLIGCGLSIAYAIVGFLLVKFTYGAQWIRAATVPAALLTATSLLHRIAIRYHKENFQGL